MSLVGRNMVQEKQIKNANYFLTQRISCTFTIILEYSVYKTYSSVFFNLCVISHCHVIEPYLWSLNIQYVILLVNGSWLTLRSEDRLPLSSRPNTLVYRIFFTGVHIMSSPSYRRHTTIANCMSCNLSNMTCRTEHTTQSNIFCCSIFVKILITSDTLCLTLVT